MRKLASLETTGLRRTTGREQAADRVCRLCPAWFRPPGRGKWLPRQRGGRWFSSADRGASWQGPFGFGSLLEHPELAGMQFTGRTAYLVQGSRELLLFLSAQRAAHADGRLCCACGNRTERRLLARFSADGGASWGEPLILRDDFHSANGWPDLGYPRLYQRRDGRLVVVYFWCTRDRPETHIEATIFSVT